MKKKSLQQIAEFIDKKAKEQLSESQKIEEIMKGKAAMKKYSSKPTKEFTFTVGDVGAGDIRFWSVSIFSEKIRSKILARHLSNRIWDEWCAGFM